MFSDPFFTKSCPAGFTGQDRVVAAETASLLAMGWTFTAEPTADSRWRVSGAKGEIRISSRAARLGDAFLEVEHEARLREQMACIPSEGVESHRNDRRSA